MIVWPAKDPAEVLDYTWNPPLDAGDTIASFTATVSTGTVIKDSAVNTDSAVTVWLSGGADGETSTVALTATTVGNRTFREVAVLPVYDRASDLLALFRLRYGAFAGISDGVVGYWLADALQQVDTSWASGDQDPAKLAWAAHMMESLGLRSAGQSLVGITSFRSGTFSATLSNNAADRVGLAATVYGREFLMLRRRNFGGAIPAWNPPTALPYGLTGDCDV